MKVTAVAILGFIATGVVAGGSPPKCKEIIYNPPRCPHYPRDVFDIEERDDLEERDDFEERDVDGLEERDVDDLEERGGSDYYPPNCKQDCKKDKIKCTKTGWAKGSPKYGGSFKDTISCKYSSGYTVTGSIQPCKKYSSSQCLVINYNGKTWPSNHQKSYLGIYNKSSGGPKSPDSLNYSNYCYGNACSIPVEKLPGYPNLCGDDLWVAVDAGRCKNPSYGKPLGNKVDYVKLEIGCTGKKVCLSSCCNV